VWRRERKVKSSVGSWEHTKLCVALDIKWRCPQAFGQTCLGKSIDVGAGGTISDVDWNQTNQFCLP
jgi:hypothetical protein